MQILKFPSALLELELRPLSESWMVKFGQLRLWPIFSFRWHFPCFHRHLYDPSHRETFESAHSVILSVFTCRAQRLQRHSHTDNSGTMCKDSENSDLVMKMVPFYAQCLLEVSYYVRGVFFDRRGRSAYRKSLTKPLTWCLIFWLPIYLYRNWRVERPSPDRVRPQCAPMHMNSLLVMYWDAGRL